MKKLTGTITAIRAGKNLRTRRSNVFLDGKFAFSLDDEVIATQKLEVGGELFPEYTKRLIDADQFRRCLNAALNFLSYRPRSESETRIRLEHRGFEILEIDKVISELKRLDLINDSKFAEFWKDNRNSFRPRSRRMVKQELLHKGIETSVIDEVIDTIDDKENAYQVAIKKAKRLPLTDFQTFRQKLGSHLQRRGFDYSVIEKVIKQTWEERTSEEP